VQPRFQVVRRDRERGIQHTLIVANLCQRNESGMQSLRTGSVDPLNIYDDFELLELPEFDLPEPESLDDELDDGALEEEESAVDAEGLLLPESDLLSEAAAEISVLPSDLLAESEDFADLLPDLA
jgi:hypothetical protein